jgi:hypothetical protein
VDTSLTCPASAAWVAALSSGAIQHTGGAEAAAETPDPGINGKSFTIQLYVRRQQNGTASVPTDYLFSHGAASTLNGLSVYELGGHMEFSLFFDTCRTSLTYTADAGV